MDQTVTKPPVEAPLPLLGPRQYGSMNGLGLWSRVQAGDKVCPWPSKAARTVRVCGRVRLVNALSFGVGRHHYIT